MAITPNLSEIGLNLVNDPVYTHRFYYQGVTGSIRWMPSVDDDMDRFMGRVDGATEPRIVWVDDSTIYKGLAGAVAVVVNRTLDPEGL